MRWIKRPVDSEQVRELSKACDIDLMTSSILARRGVGDEQDLKFFLEHEITHLHNPFLFEDMESAVDRMLEAREEGEKVRIFGDRDADGITSTVLLVEALQRLGIDVSWRLPQGDAPYGLTKEGVREFAAEDGTLIITVDCGISNFEEIALAAELGMDTLILDHHLPGESLPPAFAIIDPKIEGSGYPFSHLAGCGVAAKFIWALNFSQTDLYQQELVLLHVRPGNDTYILEAAKIENLIVTDRIQEEIVPGILSLERSRLADFLIGCQILVYDEKLVTRMLRQAFGPHVEIHLIETAAEIGRVVPSAQGKSLLRILQLSRSLRYQKDQVTELDAFVSLFTAYVSRREPSLSSEYVKILDLVAIGTVADLMPMKNENRILVSAGLEQIRLQSRPSLVTFLTMQNLLGKKLSTTDIGWQVSPIFNAAGRMGVPSVAAEMLLSDDPVYQQQQAERLSQLNRERKRIGEDAWGRLLPRVAKSLDEHNERMIVLSDKGLNRGITGIIASRLLNTYGVPSMVIASDVDGKIIGSMRSGKDFNVKQFLELFDDILIDHGGHPCAGGFSMVPNNFDEFMRRVKRESRSITQTEQQNLLIIDAELPHAYMNPELIQVVERLEPYGEEHPPLQFLVRDAVIDELSFVGSGQQTHARLLIRSGTYKWPAIFWRAGDRVGKDFSRGDSVDLVFRLGRNYYKSTETLQLTVLDMARSGSAPLTNE